MGAFAEKAKETLQGLKFETKRAIILNTIERVISTQSQLQVIGYIPLNVQLFTHHRNCGLPNVGKSTLFKALTKIRWILQLSLLHHRAEYRDRESAG